MNILLQPSCFNALRDHNIRPSSTYGTSVCNRWHFCAFQYLDQNVCSLLLCSGFSSWNGATRPSLPYHSFSFYWLVVDRNNVTCPPHIIRQDKDLHHHTGWRIDQWLERWPRYECQRWGFDSPSCFWSSVDEITIVVEECRLTHSIGCL